MNNGFNTDVFKDNVESEEELNNFNYDSISGLGQSDYENEDLFKKEEQVFSAPATEEEPVEKVEPLEDGLDKDATDEYKIEPIEEPIEESVEPVKSTESKEEDSVDDEEPTSKLAEELYTTPIEDLNKLTEYKKDDIEPTNINTLFDKVNVNVKEASDIFKKNTEMKQKIDSRFNELKSLQAEIEKKKQSQLDEINSYKDEVLNKLTNKKEEIEKRLNALKDLQASLEKEKKEFEEHKKEEQEKIDRIQKEVQTAYDDRREELNHIEDVLRKQKDSLDEERSQLSLDKIQYESDKNELANNLLKFNELVDSFTNGMNDVKE